MFNNETNADELSPLTLAFVGDAVYSLFIREMLVCEANRPVKKLHSLSVKWVQASSQAKCMKKLLPLLTEKEEEVFKRGRNAHTSHIPKNQSVGDYHYATAFESLLGYLYLNNEIDRLKYFLNEALNDFDNKEGVDK